MFSYLGAQGQRQSAQVAGYLPHHAVEARGAGGGACALVPALHDAHALGCWGFRNPTGYRNKAYWALNVPSAQSTPPRCMVGMGRDLPTNVQHSASKLQ